MDFAACLLDIRPETLIYCCGPEPLLNVVEGASAHWPAGSLRVERFVPKQIDASGDVAFEVEFVDSGVTLTIPADKSILEVAQAAGSRPCPPAAREPAAPAKRRSSRARPTTATPS